MKHLIILWAFSIILLEAHPIPKLSRGSNNSLNLSTPDGDHTIPYLGKLKSLMIFVDFPNLEGKNNPYQPEEIAEKLLGIQENGEMSIVDFYQQQSNGKFSFEIDIEYQWMRLKNKKSTDYPDSYRPIEYIEDSLLLAQKSGLRLRNYQIVYIVAPKGMRHNSPTHYLSERELGKVRNPPKVVVTFGDDGQQSRIQHLIHETGHGMGLPDLYLYDPKNEPNEFIMPGPWDIMADNWTANYFCAWSRHLWEWIPKKNKQHIKRGKKEIELVSIDSKTGIKMITIPSEQYPDELIVFETPKPWKKTVKNGILIYKVNGTIGTGKGPMTLQLPDEITNASDNNALWQPGQTYTNQKAKVEVQIIKETENGFLINIVKD